MRKLIYGAAETKQKPIKMNTGLSAPCPNYTFYFRPFGRATPSCLRTSFSKYTCIRARCLFISQKRTTQNAEDERDAQSSRSPSARALSRFRSMRHCHPKEGIALTVNVRVKSRRTSRKYTRAHNVPMSMTPNCPSLPSNVTRCDFFADSLSRRLAN